LFIRLVCIPVYEHGHYKQQCKKPGLAKNDIFKIAEQQG